MKRFLLLLSLLFLSATPLYALTIEEAVGLALENNHAVKEQALLVDAQKERVRMQEGYFLPTIDLGYSFTWKDKALVTTTNEDSTASAELTYNIFNKLVDTRELNASKAMLKSAMLMQKSVRADIVLSLKKAYIGVLRAGQDLLAAKEAVELLERQRKDAELYYREGLFARNDLLKVEVELASTRQALLQAESSRRTALMALNRITGLSTKDGELSDIGQARPIETDREVLGALMLKRRSDLAYIKALREASLHKRDALRGMYMPRVDFTAGYYRYGDSLFPGSRDNMHDTEASASVRVTWTVFSGFKNTRAAAAQDSHAKSLQEKIKDTEQALFLQLEIALEGYRVSAGRLKVAQKAVEQAHESYRITDSQFRQRMATTTDLIDARAFLTRARKDFNNAHYGMHEAIAEIERVIEGPPLL